MLKQVSEQEFDKLIAEADARKAMRAEKMPTEAAALAQMFEAHLRLEEMGWKDAVYCPKDGSEFSAIESGSTGIHLCTYSGEWPKGMWWIHDGDTWPARPILWRPRKPDDPVVNKGLAMDYDCRHAGSNASVQRRAEGTSDATDGSALGEKK
jgi:hypothetical protein